MRFVGPGPVLAVTFSVLLARVATADGGPPPQNPSLGMFVQYGQDVQIRVGAPPDNPCKIERKRDGYNWTPAFLVEECTANVAVSQKLCWEEDEWIEGDCAHDPEDCVDCPNNAVCWGCRAAAFYRYGNVFAQDPNCYLCGNKKIKNKRG